MLTQTSRCALALLSVLPAKMGHSMTSSDILLEIEKLGKVGTVLYVAAHPDDENTALLAYLAQEERLETAYLSLTRGGGGQNLIGSELNAELGLIRANELLQARKIDGATQLFTRARDFGYSKNPEDTLENWEEDEVLGDVVYAVRYFKPDVIITRFNPDEGPTHGHHTVSAQLALRAFSLAADSRAFPAQLETLKPHQAKRIFWNGFSPRRREGGPPAANLEGGSREVVSLEIGQYNPYLGTSYTELSAQSRSMHKSQGFGRAGHRGSQRENLVLLEGEPAEGDYLRGIDTSWRRFTGTDRLDSFFEKAIADYAPSAPWQSVPILMEIDSVLESLPRDRRVDSKRAALSKVVAAAMGLHFMARAPQSSVVPGQSLELELEWVNRSPLKVRARHLEASLFQPSSWPSAIELTRIENLDRMLAWNEVETFSVEVIVPEDAPLTQPYWLAKEASVGLYQLGNQRLLELETIPSPLSVSAEIEVEGRLIRLNVPVVQVLSDPVEGEVRENVVVRPEIAVAPGDSILLFENAQAKDVEVVVRSQAGRSEGRLVAAAPEGWKVEVDQPSFELAEAGDSQTLTAWVIPPGKAAEGAVVFSAVDASDRRFDSSFKEIHYPHIGRHPILSRAATKVARLDLARGGNRIACIEGVGDTVPETLRRIGYAVEKVAINELVLGRLENYDTVILGPRVFDAHTTLDKRFDVLLDYVEKGGTLVSQYNTTSFRAKSQFSSPYPIRLSRERVSEEKVEMRILQPDHPVFNWPNQIDERDFDNWIQERGLYFASSWDDRYEALLSANDRGEPPRDGGLLVARYGEGWYVYTGLSFFRQLPQGNSGAIRLFVNLISLGHGE